MTASGVTGDVRACPFCGAPVEDGDQFCENCGRPLRAGAEIAAGLSAADPGGGTPPGAPSGVGSMAAPPATPDFERATARPTSDLVPTVSAGTPTPTNPCVNCGAPPDEIDPDGYCTVCGRRQPSRRDHQETDLGWAAGVTDRGRHARNEDAFFLDLAGDGGMVAVVCDGVSASVQPDAASQAAVDAAGIVLVEAARSGPEQLEAATVEAMAVAQKAVSALPWVSHDDLASPSCTFVSAACRDDRVAIGWAGDSRAYRIDDHGVRQLTVDNSWAEAQVTAGLMTEIEADADPRSHAITRWLGADAPEVEAQTVSMQMDAPGRLLLCSDGLWNYAPTESQMADLVAAGTAVSPLELARMLTTFALEAGGHDNITVVVIDLKGIE